VHDGQPLIESAVEWFIEMGDPPAVDRAIARSFAEHWSGIGHPDEIRAKEMSHSWGGGIVLEALAPAEAVLLIREAEDYYDEGEVVVDPFKLEKVTVAERLCQPDSARVAIGRAAGPLP